MLSSASNWATGADSLNVLLSAQHVPVAWPLPLPTRSRRIIGRQWHLQKKSTSQSSLECMSSLRIFRADESTETLDPKNSRHVYFDVFGRYGLHYLTPVVILTHSLVLLPIYEFVITFDQEVAAVWLRGKKLTFGSLLLLSTRWCMFLSALVAFIPTPTTVRGIISTDTSFSNVFQRRGISALRYRSVTPLTRQKLQNLRCDHPVLSIDWICTYRTFVTYF